MRVIPDSPQAYYDRLVQTSLEGGFPALGKSLEGDVICVYRTEDGRACGVGLLIPDDKYSPAMESKMATNLFLRWPSLLPPWASPVQLLEIQNCHDDYQYLP